MPSLHEAQFRHAQYFECALRLINDLFERGGEEIKTALNKFELEWKNIKAAQEWSATYSEMDDVAAQLCSAFASVSPYLLDLRQHPRDRIRWNTFAIAAARRLRNHFAEGAHLGNLSNAHAIMGAFQKAIAFSNQALEIAREVNDLHAIRAILITLANCHGQLGEHRTAIQLLNHVVELSQMTSDQETEGSAHCNLGIAYEMLGLFELALKSYEEALSIARRMGNKRIECSTLINIGLACTKLDRMPDAENYYKHALIITREIGELRGEGLVLFNWSLLLVKQGKHESAIEQAQAAFELLNNLEDPNAIKVREQLIKWREKAKLSLSDD